MKKEISDIVEEELDSSRINEIERTFIRYIDERNYRRASEYFQGLSPSEQKYIKKHHLYLVKAMSISTM